MLKIAICDDDKTDINRIKKSVIDVFKSINIPINIETFSDAHLLLHNNLSDPFDIIFLDLDMPTITGMDAAEKLNSQGNISEFIFVTNHDELVYKAYKFKALGFIRKKYLNTEIEEIVDLFVEQRNRQHKYLIIHDSGIAKKIALQDIVYMQSDDHYIDIFTMNSKGIIRRSLNDMETEYSIYGFIRIHARYLVNYRYIYSIEKSTVILNDKTHLPMSRSRINTVKDSFMLFSRRI